jgi:flagellar protein FlaJ
MREEIKRIQSQLLSSGSDPVSVIERVVKDVGIKEYKDLFMGYASTIKTGGDVVHYIYTQTESMFRSFATRIKGMGEIIGSLMEGYMIVGVLGTLGLYMIFIISMTQPTGGGFSQESFFLFAFVVIPIMSALFMYLGDLFHIKYPSSNQKAYVVLAASVPLGVFLATQMFFPFFYRDILIFPPFETFVISLRSGLNFVEGSEAALGLAISLAVISVPAAIADYYYGREEKGVLDGITMFLRDMTENRKTGLGPEKCIRILSRKDYGRLSKYLKRVNSQMNWGFPMASIMAEFRRGVKNWLAQINMYLLIDTIVVGGGNEESFETLAEFAETSASLEKERKAMLNPLLIIPLIGAVLLVVTATMFLNFFSSMSGMLQPVIPIVTLRQILITPLVLHDFLLGLVTGKIVSGRVSSGFKTGLFLVVLAMAGIWLSPHMSSFIEFAS